MLTSCNSAYFDLESVLKSIIMMKMWRRLLYLTTLVLTESSFMFLIKQRLKKMSFEITTNKNKGLVAVLLYHLISRIYMQYILVYYQLTKKETLYEIERSEMLLISYFFTAYYFQISKWAFSSFTSSIDMVGNYWVPKYWRRVCYTPETVLCSSFKAPFFKLVSWLLFDVYWGY